MATDNYQVKITLTGDDRASGPIRRVKDALDDVDDSASGLGKALDGIGGKGEGMMALGKAAQVLGGALAGIEIGQMVVQLTQLGYEANATETVFRQLSSTAGGYEAVLGSLRNVTNNVVDDMTLMQGASQLLKMGLAESGDEVARLTELAVKLKSPTMSAADAVAEFGVMLANNSVERLDQFGISSGKVRQRMEELLATGQALNREDAFKLATLEIGAQSLERLGSAADVGATALAKLQTRLANIQQDVGQGLATSVEAGAQVLEIGAMSVEVGLGDVIEAAQDPLKARTRQVFQNVMANVAGNLADPASESAKLMQGAFARYPDFLLGTEFKRNMTARFSTLGAMNSDLLNQFAEGRLSSGQQEALNQEFGLNTPYFVEQARQVAQAVAQEQVLIAQAAARARMDAERAVQAEMQRTREIARDERMGELEDGSRQRLGLELAGNLLDGLGNALTQTRELANAAWDAAEAFNAMSLSELFGQEGGGRLGELSDMVLGNIDDDAVRAKLEDAFALATGRETVVSQAFEQEFAPVLAAIAEKMGPEAATKAMRAALAALETGKLAGMDDATIMRNVQSAIGFKLTTGGATAGTGFTVKPGDTPSGIAAATGLSLDEVYAATGGRGSAFLPGNYTAGGGTGGTVLRALGGVSLAAGDDALTMRGATGAGEGGVTQLGEELTGVSETVTNIKSDLQSIAEQRFEATIKVKLVLDDPNGLANMPGFGDAVKKVTRDNGGTTPGTIPTRSRD